MDKARWDKISTIVDKIITLNKKDQTSYLEKTLAGQDELIAEVKEYLQAIEESEKEQFLENPLSDYSTLFKELAASEFPVEPDSEELLGMQIGPYKVESLIAQGGMGSVYLAKRVDGQFEQKVAIKFINQSNLSEEGLHRFQQEQKILANLRHHNIAMLLDGGISKNGRPFLILEYIEGTPIDEYCNSKNLSISQRLNLFKEVLQTIQYAHSNLVIHRDLKPSNILVTASGEVKILDFGIAKFLDNNLDDDLLKTQPGQRLWTPSYAAPEQVQEKPSVTQTDVYALGGLLHKLLSNKPALNFNDDKIHQIESKILKSNPDGILSAIGSQEEADIVKIFGVKKSTLKKQLRSDLEAIVQKALRKEPEHRYHSVSLFLDDITRYENNLPISAKKDNFKYLASKFYRRNKQPLIYTSLIIAAIISMASYYTIQINEQRHIAELEAEKATQVSNYLSKLFSHNYPENAQGEDVTARQLLDQGVDQLNSLDNQPEVQIAMLNLFSNIYHNIEDLNFADSLALKAIEVNEKQEINNAKELAASNYTLGLVHRDNGNYGRAIDYMQRSLDLDGLTNTPADSNYAARLSALAYVLRLNDNLEEAAGKNSRAIEIQRRLYKDKNINLAESIYIQASILRVLGRYEEALEHQFDSYNMVKELVDPPHPGLAVNLSNIALIMQKTGRHEESEKYNRESLKMAKKLYGENNSMVATSIRNLAASIQSQGRLDEALQYQKDALSISLNNFGDNHINTAYSYDDLGEIYTEQGEVDKADSLLKKALEIKVSVFGEESIQISKTLSNLAEVEVKKGNSEKALEYLMEGLKIRNERLGETHQETQKMVKRIEELSSVKMAQ